MNNFTPLTATAGGLLIGAAAVLYLLLTGRYAGISGIARGAAFGDPDRLVDVMFVAGLVIAGIVAAVVHPPIPGLGTTLWAAGIGGILVGIGTSFGRGCTSGHGVCGLGRFSLRSLTAVVAFVSAGMATVFVIRHVVGG